MVSEFLPISDFQECYHLWGCVTLGLKIQFGASWDPTHPDEERLAWVLGGQLQVTQATPNLTIRTGWVGLTPVTGLGGVAIIKTPSLH